MHDQLRAGRLQLGRQLLRVGGHPGARRGLQRHQQMEALAAGGLHPGLQTVRREPLAEQPGHGATGEDVRPRARIEVQHQPVRQPGRGGVPLRHVQLQTAQVDHREQPGAVLQHHLAQLAAVARHLRRAHPVGRAGRWVLRHEHLGRHAVRAAQEGHRTVAQVRQQGAVDGGVVAQDLALEGAGPREVDLVQVREREGAPVDRHLRHRRLRGCARARVHRALRGQSARRRGTARAVPPVPAARNRCGPGPVGHR